MARPDGDAIAWVSHPLREESPARTACLVMIIAVVGAVVASVAESALAGVAGAGLLVAATSRYFLPTRYALDDAGITIAHAGRRRLVPWERVARFDLQKGGVFVSPFPRRSRLDSFQGSFLRIPGPAEEILARIEAGLGNT